VLLISGILFKWKRVEDEKVGGEGVFLGLLSFWGLVRFGGELRGWIGFFKWNSGLSKWELVDGA
jgi:hypothetical protein